jgi:mannose-6-phosphate isomerase-like protein (cupin superfamily)
MISHEDSRRIIYDWSSNGLSKAVIVKDAIAIGDHHHNNKDEEFFLLQGEFKELIIGDLAIKNISAPYYVFIKKGVYHKFICTPGSILLGISTAPFDPEDEIKMIAQ